MHLFSVVKVFVVILITVFIPGFAHATTVGKVVIDLGRGPVTVHVPESYDPNTPMPLVMLLHGYSSNGQQAENYFQFLPLSEQYGFLYVHPDGSRDFINNRFWNATDACCDLFNSGVDDSTYLRAMIEEIKVQLNVDDDRVYVTGHSNGGFMSYRMACDHADSVAAIASLAGATFLDTNQCQPTEPVHTLQIHGTSDSVILYNGGCIGSNCYPGAVETTETWAFYDGCEIIADDTAPPLNLDQGIPGDETLVTRYITECNPGGSAELWTIVGGAHVPDISKEFSPLVIEYLYSHARVISQSAKLVGFTVISGNLLTGTVADLEFSDDSYLHTSSGFGETLVDLHNMEMIVNAVTTVDSASTIDLTIESRIDEPAGIAQIRMHNWNTNQFESVGSYSIGNADQIDTINDVDAANYIDGSGNIDLSIKHLVFVPFLAFTFESFIDQVDIVVE